MTLVDDFNRLVNLDLDKTCTHPLNNTYTHVYKYVYTHIQATSKVLRFAIQFFAENKCGLELRPKVHAWKVTLIVTDKMTGVFWSSYFLKIKKITARTTHQTQVPNWKEISMHWYGWQIFQCNTTGGELS